MLQQPSSLMGMVAASLRLPDSQEFNVDVRRRAATTTANQLPGSSSILTHVKNEFGDYFFNNSLLTESSGGAGGGGGGGGSGGGRGGSDGVVNLRSAMEAYSTRKFINSSSDSFNLSDLSIEQVLPDRLLYRHSVAMSAVYCVAYIVVFVVGLIGNSFVIAVVYRSPRMRTVTNFFIVNLAVADVLVIIFCLPATLMSNIFVRKYHFSSISCFNAHLLAQKK